jgi:hypothetical protein
VIASSAGFLKIGGRLNRVWLNSPDRSLEDMTRGIATCRHRSRLPQRRVFHPMILILMPFLMTGPLSSHFSWITTRARFVSRLNRFKCIPLLSFKNTLFPILFSLLLFTVDRLHSFLMTENRFDQIGQSSSTPDTGIV